MRADTDIDDGSRVALPWIDVPSGGPVELEAQWWAAAPGAADGGLRLWVDGVLAGETTSLDNASRRVDAVRLGLLGADPGSAGTVRY